MTTYQNSIVVGIFQDEIQAKNAVDTLRNAGFQYDQVGVAIQGSQNATANLRTDLENLGVPQDRADYYDKEYQSGHIVISVRPDGRESEVQDILKQVGAYDFPAEQDQDAQSAAASTTSTDSAEEHTNNTESPDAQE